MIIKSSIAFLAAAFLFLGCGDEPDRPSADGYTLQGVVLDADTGAPVSQVNVMVGLEPDLDYRPLAVTDTVGAFTFQPSPATAPNNEVFRLEKTGYASVEVRARTATRLGEYRYRLEMRIQRERAR